MFELWESTRLERAQATEKQLIAEIKNPLKTGFRRDLKDLDPELEAALEILWRTGPRSRDLYVKFGKGLATMTREDLFCLLLLRETPARIEDLAPLLTSGVTLAQALISAPPPALLLLPPPHEPDGD